MRKENNSEDSLFYKQNMKIQKKYMEAIYNCFNN